MKKLLAILVGGALIVLLAACDISSFLKPKSGQQTQQQPTENPPPDQAPPPDQPPPTEPPPPAAPPPTQPTQPRTQPAQPHPQTQYQEPPRSNYPPPSNQPNYNQQNNNQQNYSSNNPPPSNQGSYSQPSGTASGYGQSNIPQAKIKPAGLGVIFTGNLPQGQFRVKVDQELVYELAFSGTETRATKEIQIQPGQHLIRFAVIDAKGVRGLKEETFTFKPGAHQTVRVGVKDTPGAIIVEHLD